MGKIRFRSPTEPPAAMAMPRIIKREVEKAVTVGPIARSVMDPEAVKILDNIAAKAGVGRPPSGKVRVTMLLDPDVIAKFKATGRGWQSRMNGALKAAIP